MPSRSFALAAFLAATLLVTPVFADEPSTDTPAADTPAVEKTADTPAPDTAPVPVSPEETVNATQTPPVAFTKDGEIRAMWVVRDSMTSPQKIKNAVALAKKYGFNTLFVQVRGRGDAFYTSQYEPRAEQLAHTSGDFDPLEVAVSEGHKAGLEVHAWLNTFLVWHSRRNPYSPNT